MRRRQAPLGAGQGTLQLAPPSPPPEALRGVLAGVLSRPSPVDPSWAPCIRSVPAAVSPGRQSWPGLLQGTPGVHLRLAVP
jgi:hypothetical protein